MKTKDCQQVYGNINISIALHSVPSCALSDHLTFFLSRLSDRFDYFLHETTPYRSTLIVIPHDGLYIYRYSGNADCFVQNGVFVSFSNRIVLCRFKRRLKEKTPFEGKNGV